MVPFSACQRHFWMLDMTGERMITTFFRIYANRIVYRCPIASDFATFSSQGIVLHIKIICFSKYSNNLNILETHIHDDAYDADLLI